MIQKVPAGPSFNIEPANPPNDGILFSDKSAVARSGHLGHALVEYAPGRLLAFNSNCSDVNKGHNGDGWMEYRRSEDGGRTWGEAVPLEYSKRIYESGKGRSVLCEKAVRTDEGVLILFNLECGNRPETNFTWQPLDVPTYLESRDEGRTWSEPWPMGNEPGRIWDALYAEGVIYVLELHNDSTVSWYGNHAAHHYSLYVGSGAGHSFHRRSILPFDFTERGYGALAFLPDGGLVAYVYNQQDEKLLEYTVSHDRGHTWGAVQTTHLAKQIRNPQVAAFNGGYVLHGRSGSMGPEEVKGHLVLYTSPDGIHWDEGRDLQLRTAGSGAYSNNLLVHDPAGARSPRLLIQASHAYEESKTNIHHWWLT